MAKHYATSGVSLRFMGQEFDGRDALAKAYPKFAADDAFRAIKAGASTPMEVEVYCFEWRNRSVARERKRKAALANGRGANVVLPRKRRKAA